jgi:L-threonylcarbamoyladenylate synthase
VTPAVLEADDPGALERAVALLRDGEVVAVPTDTVYGLAVDPRLPEAVERVFALKERPAAVALPILVGSAEQVEVVAGVLESAARGLADRWWPGPLTLVVPRKRGFDADLGGGPTGRWTVGVRWPDHPVVRALCLAVGPLAVTSANPHGRPPATTADEVAGAFVGAGSLAAVLDGGVCAGLPSTVVECRGPASRCLREGRIPWAEVGRG